ncbi:hypothetical protein AAKU64_000035 [Undibacterium sp. GrIS 1.8]
MIGWWIAIKLHLPEELSEMNTDYLAPTLASEASIGGIGWQQRW